MKTKTLNKVLKISSKLRNDGDKNYLTDMISRVTMNLKWLNNYIIAQKSVKSNNEEQINYFAGIL